MRLSGLDRREVARRLVQDGVSVTFQTINNIVNKNQRTARTDLIEAMARLCSIRPEWLRSDVPVGRPLEEANPLAPSVDATQEPDWVFIGLMRQVFLVQCLRAAKRDFINAGNTESDWLRIRQQAHGAFFHVIDPDHWRRRLTRGDPRSVSLQEYAARSERLYRSFTALLAPWFRGKEPLDYEFVQEIADRENGGPGPQRFLPTEGFWMTRYWREQGNNKGATE